MKAPRFWYRRPGLRSALLAPLAGLYAGAARRRLAAAQPRRVGVPVICVGNLVAGGAGKTPVALALYERLRSAGHTPHFLSRGYGGRLSGPKPVRVDPARHGPDAVGDEPLLLAAHGPAWICTDRAAGAAAAADAGADVIVMDDGYQNPGLHQDLPLLVVDGAVGFGNGRVIPAGPLREELLPGLARAAAVIIVGDDKAGVARRLRRLTPALPLLTARLVPDPGAAAMLAGRRAVAFAGIGRPDKFFTTCTEMGITLLGNVPFPDHHPYTIADLRPLVEKADRAGALTLTTQKDWIRIPTALRNRITALPVRLRFDDIKGVDALLSPCFPPHPAPLKRSDPT